MINGKLKEIDLIQPNHNGFIEDEEEVCVIQREKNPFNQWWIELFLWTKQSISVQNSQETGSWIKKKFDQKKVCLKNAVDLIEAVFCLRQKHLWKKNLFRTK